MRELWLVMASAPEMSSILPASPPRNPELRLDIVGRTPDEAAEEILHFLAFRWTSNLQLSDLANVLL